MEEHVSKSQKKREADTLQKVGVSLVELSLEKLKLLPLTDSLYQAIVDAKRIKSHGAKRRQAQLIGKLMRAADHEAILEAYQQMLDEESAVTAAFHDVELWRDKLINEGKEALTELMNHYPVDDVQHLRQLIKKAIDDKQQEKNTGAAKALFRQLRTFIK
jgi:ribosome-associated protein